MRRYPHTVTFQTPTEARKPSGAVTLTYANATGLVDLPALVIAASRDRGGGRTDDQTDRMVLERDMYQVIVSGDRAVVPDMVALTDYAAGVYEVIRVVRPVAPMPNATIVTVERVAV